MVREMCLFFIGAQETIIYRLVMRNPSFHAYTLYFQFEPLLAEKRVWPPRAPPPKKLPPGVGEPFRLTGG